MLRGVIGAIADKRFRIDHQPWFAFTLKHVPSVQIGSE
jgi:hypothetical protein